MLVTATHGMEPHILPQGLTPMLIPTSTTAQAPTRCTLLLATTATWPIMLQLARATIGTAPITRLREHTPMTTANRVPAATMWTRCI